jgi:hypothetical protein
MLAASLLLGCSHESWTDTTRQNRTVTEMNADHQACMSAFASPLVNELDPPQAEVEAVVARVTNCMAKHGWRYSN